MCWPRVGCLTRESNLILSQIISSDSWLKLACWRMVDILNTKCDANCDTKRINLHCLKSVRKIYFCTDKLILRKAMRLMGGGTLNNAIVATGNLLLSVPVKEFWKSVNTNN